MKPNIDPSVFRDKIVFVGVTAAGLFDVFETPFAGGKMPGIQVHAAVADDILSNRLLRAASGASASRRSSPRALAIGLVATMVPGVVGDGVDAGAVRRRFAVGRDTRVRRRLLAEPVAAGAGVGSFALFGGVAYQYFVEGREKRKMKRLFGQYVSKDVYEQLVANPALARLGGQRREMTVLFSDIRGFTTVSERGQPEEIVGMLNEYFTRMVEHRVPPPGDARQVRRRHGDGALRRAARRSAARRPRRRGGARHDRRAADAERRWQAEGRPPLDIGIGINTGPMIAGQHRLRRDHELHGHRRRREPGIAARIAEQAVRHSDYHQRSDPRARLTGGYAFRPLGDVVVKGKTQPVAIFEVVGRPINGVAVPIGAAEVTG